MEIKPPHKNREERRKLSRREFTAGGLTIGFASAAAKKESLAKMGLHTKGSGLPPVTPSGGDRVFRSANGLSPTYVDLSYMWINHLQCVVTGTGGDYPDRTDADGWRNTGTPNGGPFYGGGAGFSYFMPTSLQYGVAAANQQWAVVGQGDCDFQVSLFSGIFTLDVAASRGVTELGNGRYRVTETAPYIGNTSRSVNPPWKIVFRSVHHGSRPILYSGIYGQVTNTNWNGRGYARNVCMYRMDGADEADWQAGHDFRRSFKTMVMNMNPLYLRAQAWNGVLDWCVDNRFRNRAKGRYAGQPWGWNLNGCINYPALTAGISMTPSNVPKYYVPAVAGQTPATLEHGELCQMLVPMDWSTAAGTIPGPPYPTGSGVVVSFITNAVNPTVTVEFSPNNGHGFHVGDTVFFTHMWFGMTEIHFRRATILTVPDATHFTIDLDTTSMGYFALRGINVGYVTTVGSGYTPGFYANVPAVSAITGVGGTYDITVGAGGTVTLATLNKPGQMYSYSEVLSLGAPLFGTARITLNGTDAVNPGAPGIADHPGEVAIPVYLRVGTGSNRDGPDGYGYPVMQANGYTPISDNPGAHYPMNGVMGGSNCFNAMTFDKNVISEILPNGTLRYGAWLSGQRFASNPFPGRMSLVTMEMQGKLINELEDLIIETGQSATKGPIHLWICVPTHGMLSCDPDYNVLDNYGIGMVDVLVNPTSTHRAPGFNAIPSRCKVYVEYGNEPFNKGFGDQWAGGPAYNTYQTCMRWNNWTPGTPIQYYPGDPSVWYPNAMMRIMNLNNDVKTAFPAETAAGKILYPMAAWPFGLSGGPGNYGYPVFGGMDFCAFGTPASTPNYMVNGSGNVPPGANPNFYPYNPADFPIKHFTHISPGTYCVLGGGNFYAAWFADDTKWKIPLEQFKINGGFKAVTSVAPDSVNSYWAACTTSGAHTFDVGEIVMFTDVVQSGSYDADLITNWPAYIMVSNKAAGTFTCTLDVGYNLGTFISANVMTVNRPSQDANCNTFMEWMIQPNTFVFGSTPNPPFNIVLVRQQVAQMLAKCRAVNPTIKANSYEGYIQMTAGGYGWPVPPGLTSDQVGAFMITCFQCTGLGSYVDDFFGMTRDDTNIEGIANLTFIVAKGAQWGVQFDNPWSWSPYGASDWQHLSPTQLQLEVFNALP